MVCIIHIYITLYNIVLRGKINKNKIFYLGSKCSDNNKNNNQQISTSTRQSASSKKIYENVLFFIDDDNNKNEDKKIEVNYFYNTEVIQVLINFSVF